MTRPRLPVARVVKMPPERPRPPAPVVEPIRYEAISTENIGIFGTATSTENIGIFGTATRDMGVDWRGLADAICDIREASSSR